jgi:hypothetical protein
MMPHRAALIAAPFEGDKYIHENLLKTQEKNFKNTNNYSPTSL